MGSSGSSMYRHPHDSDAGKGIGIPVRVIAAVSASDRYRYPSHDPAASPYRLIPCLESGDFGGGGADLVRVHWYHTWVYSYHTLDNGTSRHATRTVLKERVCSGEGPFPPANFNLGQKGYDASTHPHGEEAPQEGARLHSLQGPTSPIFSKQHRTERPARGPARLETLPVARPQLRFRRGGGRPNGPPADPP